MYLSGKSVKMVIKVINLDQCDLLYIQCVLPHYIGYHKAISKCSMQSLYFYSKLFLDAWIRIAIAKALRRLREAPGI